MFALRKQSFKPTLEALEDRCLLSATTSTVPSAEPVLAGFVQNVQQQLTALQGIVRNLILTLPQQLATVQEIVGDMILTLEPLSATSVEEAVMVQSPQIILQPTYINLNGGTPVMIGTIFYPAAFYRNHIPTTLLYNNGGKFVPTTQLFLKSQPPGPSDTIAKSEIFVNAPPKNFFNKGAVPYFVQVRAVYGNPPTPPLLILDSPLVTFPNVRSGFQTYGNPIIAALGQELDALQVIVPDLIFASEDALAAQLD